MSQSVYLTPERIEPWRLQRIQRLARQGSSPSRIAAICGMSVDDVKKNLDRPPRFQRCPTCRGMVLMPCRVCELRADASAKS